MSETPVAGWYDDPEDPTQYRYWDGTEWTMHRSPKPAASTASVADPIVPASAGDTLSRSFRMVFDDVGPVFGLAVLAALGFIVAVVFFVIGIVVQVDDGFDVFENDNAEFAFNVGGITLWIIGALLYIAVLATAFPTAQVRYETTRRGRSAPIGRCAGYAIRKVWRTIGRGLLVMLAYMALFVVAFVAIFVGSFGGVEWLLGLFVSLPLIIAGLPVIAVAAAGIAVAPTGVGPIRFALSAAREDWSLLAGAVYLAFLALAGVGIVGTILGLIPIVGFFVSIAASFVQTAVSIVVGQFQWIRAGGEVDPEIVAMVDSNWRA